MRNRLLTLATSMVAVAALTVACSDLPTESLDGPDAQANQSSMSSGQASGELEVTLPCMPSCDRSGGKISFTAHEGDGAASASGDVEWDAYDGNGDLARHMEWNVTQVAVSEDDDPPTAKFVGTVTFDSGWKGDDRTGHDYLFWVKDDGSPGTAGDEIRWADATRKTGLSADLNFSSSDLNSFPITDGNATIK